MTSRGLTDHWVAVHPQWSFPPRTRLGRFGGQTCKRRGARAALETTTPGLHPGHTAPRHPADGLSALANGESGFVIYAGTLDPAPDLSALPKLAEDCGFPPHETSQFAEFSGPPEILPEFFGSEPPDFKIHPNG